MGSIADALVVQLDGVVDFISSLTAVVAPLYWVSGALPQPRRGGFEPLQLKMRVSAVARASNSNMLTTYA